MVVSAYGTLVLFSDFVVDESLFSSAALGPGAAGRSGAGTELRPALGAWLALKENIPRPAARDPGGSYRMPGGSAGVSGARFDGVALRLGRTATCLLLVLAVAAAA
ncbi:MAG: hypothetical protein ACLPQS_04205 [Acidimicrobiales bacterium]|jgi:hypothetical protein